MPKDDRSWRDVWIERDEGNCWGGRRRMKERVE